MKWQGLWVLSVIVASSAASPFTKAADDLDQGSTGQKFAVLVGVQNYEDKKLVKLDYCIEDARGLAEVLMTRGFEKSNIRLLLDSGNDKEKLNISVRADRTKINGAIDELIRASRPKDTLILAFAGHGVRLRAKDGLGERSYFCPIDADPAIADSMIDLQTLYDRLKECQAGMKLLFVDACQSRVSGRGLKGVEEFRDIPSLSRQDFLGRPGNTAAFFGCAIGEESFEEKELKHGIFMHCIIKAFQGEKEAIDKESGDVTIGSLHRYIKEQVPKLCKAYGKQTQTPTTSYDAPDFNTVIVSLLKYQTLVKQSKELLALGHFQEATAKANEAVELSKEEYATWLWRAELRENRPFRRSMVIDDATNAINLLEQAAKPVANDRAIDRAIAYEIRGRNRFVQAKGNKPLDEAASREREESLKQADDDLAKCIATLPVEGLKNDPNALSIRIEALLERAEVARVRNDRRLTRQSFDAMFEAGMPAYFLEKPSRRFRYFLLEVQLLNDESKFTEAQKKVDALRSAASEIRDPMRCDSLVYLEEGRAYRGLGKSEEAISKLKFAISANSKLHEAIELLGNIYLETKQFEDARRLYEDSIAEIASVEANLGMARAFRGLKEMNKAMGYLDEVLLLVRDGAPRTRARVLTERASLRLEWMPADASKIIADCSEAILLDKELAEAYRLRAEAKQQAGDIAGADDDRRRTRELDGASISVTSEVSKK